MPTATLVGVKSFKECLECIKIEEDEAREKRLKEEAAQQKLIDARKAYIANALKAANTALEKIFTENPEESDPEFLKHMEAFQDPRVSKSYWLKTARGGFAGVFLYSGSGPNAVNIMLVKDMIAKPSEKKFSIGVFKLTGPIAEERDLVEVDYFPFSEREATFELSSMMNANYLKMACIKVASLR